MYNSSMRAEEEWTHHQRDSREAESMSHAFTFQHSEGKGHDFRISAQQPPEDEA